ncbi:MAG: hypothetical protein EP344_00020 [Bacteroidetes bacterium]|nr:MAG: hypothetical protein EP344_00020 [Bacteroidota bacterium]
MSRLFILLFTLLFAGATLLSGQTPNRPVPPWVPSYTFVLHDTSYQGYYLTTPFRITGNVNIVPLVILDSKGYIFWYRLIPVRNLADFKYRPEAQVYQFISFQNPQAIEFHQMDTGFEPAGAVSTVNGVRPDAHDFQLSRDGTYLLPGVRDTLIDLSGYLFNGLPGSAATNAVGFVVQELDADKNLLFQWNSNDHIHPGDAYSGYPYAPGNYDYCHGNTIEEDMDGHLLLSFRHLDAVYKINRQTGAILWVLGGKDSDFAFVNDAGFSGQHDVRRLPNGNLAMFDNANMAAFPKESRAVEYRLDTINWTATKVWEYRHSPALFSSSMGGHQTTSDRRHLINFGFVFRPDPSFVLVDDAGTLLVEAYFQDSVMSYRTHIFDLPVNDIQRPEVTCSQSNGQLFLTAPAGFDQYAWSTGASSPSIPVSDAGTYQVWVNYGSGMLGSEPVVVADPDTGCPVSSISEAGQAAPKSVLACYDLLGRPVPLPEYGEKRGQWYVVVYTDGTARLVGY